jgi:Ni2+-binding GTPase involved in maturation of urease and hydrogenase
MWSLAGAGKTTLVEHILTSQHGYRIAVILNEIGDTHGIEKALLQDEKGVLHHDMCHTDLLFSTLFAFHCPFNNGWRLVVSKHSR